MDQAVLVSEAQALTSYLDETKVKPRAVMWVHHPDTDVWKLWIVPNSAVADKREFYRLVAETISKNGLQGIDVGTTEFVEANHPAIQGMDKLLHMPGLGSARFRGNRFNDFYLPDGIVIRMSL